MRLIQGAYEHTCDIVESELAESLAASHPSQSCQLTYDKGSLATPGFVLIDAKVPQISAPLEDRTTGPKSSDI